MALSELDFLSDPQNEVTESSPTPYEREFLPAQSRFFDRLAADPKLGPSVMASTLRENRQLAQQSFMQRAAVEQAGMDIKARQLQFETAKFTLDQSREKAARERNSMSDLARLTEELTPLVKDSSLDFDTRKNAFTQVAVKFGPLAAINPAAEYMLNAVQSNVSGSTPRKDRVTKFDYINNGADMDVLKAYEAKLGRSLGADEETPIDLFAEGKAKTMEKQGLLAVAVERDKDKKRAQEEGAKILAKTVLEGKLLKNTMNPSAVSSEFESPATKEALSILVGDHGNPEEQKRFPKAKVAEQLSIGQKVAFRVQSGIRIPVEKKPSLASGFTTPSAPK